MGNCCSTCLRPKKKKQKRKSTAWSESSGSSYSSSLPSAKGKNPCNHNVARPKYLTEPCSPFDLTNLWPSAEPLNERFSRKTGALPIWAESQKERIAIQQERAIWERERHLVESSSQSSSSGEEDETRLDSITCYTSGVPRLKKKDSTRHPTYKDKIMLTDNIDSIIDQEIPNEEDLKGACAEPSGSSTAQNLTRAKYALRDGACISGSAGPSCSSAANVPSKMNGRWRHNVRIIEEEVEADDLVSVPLSFQSVSVPANVRNNLPPMDEEDLRVAQEIQEILRQDALKEKEDEEVALCLPEPAPVPEETGSAGTPTSDFEYLDEDTSKLYSPASSTPSIAGTLSPQMDDQLAQDLDYILNDDIPAEVPEGPDSGVATSLEENHVAKVIIPTAESNKPAETNLEKNVHCRLDDDIVAAEETHEASSSADFQRPKISSTPELPKHDSAPSLVDDLSMDEEVETTEIEYILSEEVPAVESPEGVDSNSVTAAQPDQYSVNTPHLEDEDGVECIPLPEASPSRSSVVSNLGNDCVQSAPRREQQSSKTTVNILQFHVQDDSLSSNPDARLHLQWAYPANTRIQKLTDSSLPSPKVRNSKCDFSETTQKLAEEVIAMDVETVLRDEKPAPKLNWYGAAPRPKTRNPRRDLVVNAEKSVNVIPSIRQKYNEVGNQDMTPNQTAPQSVGPGARPKTSIIKKPLCREDIEMAKAFNETSEKPDSVLGFSLGASTDCARKQATTLSSICRESEVVHTKKSVANLIRVREFKRSTALPPLDRSGRNSESPYAKSSGSSIDTRFCDSSCSVVNGDALRPMAVRSSKVASPDFNSDTVSPSCLEDARMPRPPTKGKSRRLIIFVRPAPGTRILGVGAHRKAAEHTEGSQSGACAQACSGNGYYSEKRYGVEQSYDAAKLRMAVNRKAAEHTDDSQSGACAQICSGNGNYSEEHYGVEHSYEAEKLRMAVNRKAAVCMDGRQSGANAQTCSGNEYDSEELYEVEHSYDAEKLRMAVNRKAAVPLDVRRSSCSQRSSVGWVHNPQHQKLMTSFERNVDRPMAEKVSDKSRRRSTSAKNDNSPQSMASHGEAAGPVSDTDGHAFAGLLYTAEELGLMAHIEGQLD